MKYMYDTSVKLSILIKYILLIFFPLSWITLGQLGSIYRLLSIVCIFLYFVLNYKNIIISKENKNILISWLCLIVSILLPLLWMDYVEYNISETFGYILIFFIATIYMTNSKKYNNNNLSNLDFAWFIIGFITVIIFFIAEKKTYMFSSRKAIILWGSSTDPNELSGIFIVPISLLTYYLYKFESIYRRLIIIIIMSVMLYVVLLTGSRGGFFGAIIGIFITILYQSRNSLKKFLFMMLIILFGMFIFYIMFYHLIPEDIIERFYTINQDRGSNRFDMWISAFNEFNENNFFLKLFGTGATNFTMHNTPLQILMNYGIVGLIFYFILLYNIYVTIMKNNQKYIGAFWGCQFLSLTLSLGPSCKFYWFSLFTTNIYVISNENNNK